MMITDTTLLPTLDTRELAETASPTALTSDELAAVGGGLGPLLVVGGALVAGFAVGAGGAGFYKWAMTCKFFTW